MNDDPLYTLGGVVFSAKNRPLTGISSDFEAKWAIMERLQLENTLQFTGVANKGLTFNGVTFPTLGMEQGEPAGTKQVQELESLAAEGIPVPLVDGYGNYYDLWAILRVSEEKENFLRTGAHLASTYTVSLLRYVSNNVDGENGIVASGSFDLSKWREQVASFVGSLSNLFQ